MIAMPAKCHAWRLPVSSVRRSIKPPLQVRIVWNRGSCEGFDCLWPHNHASVVNRHHPDIRLSNNLNRLLLWTVITRCRKRRLHNSPHNDAFLGPSARLYLFYYVLLWPCHCFHPTFLLSRAQYIRARMQIIIILRISPFLFRYVATRIVSSEERIHLLCV